MTQREEEDDNEAADMSRARVDGAEVGGKQTAGRQQFDLLGFIFVMYFPAQQMSSTHASSSIKLIRRSADET